MVDIIMSAGLVVRIAIFGVVLYLLAQCAAKMAKPVADDQAYEKEMIQKQAERGDPYGEVVAQLDTLNLSPELHKCLVEQMPLVRGKILGGKLTTPTEITSLSCTNDGIDSLAGIEQFTALKTLDLSGNRISDVTPLRKLQSLEKLTLANNQIGSIWTMIPLSNLKTLNLRGNPVSDIHSLHSNPSLEKVDFYFTGEETCSSLDRFFQAQKTQKFKLSPPQKCIDEHGDKVPY